MTICCVCVFFILMCAFFVDDAHAAFVTKGTTTRKEQTVKVNLGKGTCVITVRDNDSWVYAQLQKTGNNKLGTAVEGETLLATLGQQKTFTVPVRKAGTYYLYLHGTNKGATYSVQHVRPSGVLKSGVPRLGTSYANNHTIVFYRINIPETGTLRVTVKDASYRYPGYSKIRLRKNKKNYTGEEHLIKGLGYSTVYGVRAGAYSIGVRSSSELYNLTATFTPVKTMSSGETRREARLIARKVNARGIFAPNSSDKRWYKIELPERKKPNGKRTLIISAKNNNQDIRGGIRFTVSVTRKGKKRALKKTYTLNNASATRKIAVFKKMKRKVFIRVSTVRGATGSYTICWK